MHAVLDWSAMLNCIGFFWEGFYSERTEDYTLFDAQRLFTAAKLARSWWPFLTCLRQGVRDQVHGLLNLCNRKVEVAGILTLAMLK